jgi:outer membrane lipoprotein
MKLAHWLQRPTTRLQLTTIILVLLLTACVHPITKEVREQIDPKTTFAMVSENPMAFLDQHLLIGGAVIAIENNEEGSMLEVLEWRLSRWGEPSHLDDSGRRFLVKTSELLDPARYEPGTLITLAGVVLGHEARLSGEHEYDYPVFELTEIHLWHTPFRYGIHNNLDPSYPYYVGEDDDPHRHPYDPGYNPYPYTQYWYRNSSY